MLLSKISQPPLPFRFAAYIAMSASRSSSTAVLVPIDGSTTIPMLALAAATSSSG
jgi:hypothetical protein